MNISHKYIVLIFVLRCLKIRTYQSLYIYIYITIFILHSGGRKVTITGNNLDTSRNPTIVLIRNGKMTDPEVSIIKKYTKDVFI